MASAHYTVQPGQNIYNAAQEATDIARRHGHAEVEFTFNEIVLRTTPTSNPDDITRIYSLKCEIRRLRQ